MIGSIKLFTQFDRPPDSKEVNSGEKITESAGYVEANVLIENMIYAGERLELARQEMYDFPSDEEVPDDYVDPTRSPGFDAADASFIARSANGRIAEQRKLFEAEEAARKATAEAAPQTAPKAAPVAKGAEEGK